MVEWIKLNVVAFLGMVLAFASFVAYSYMFAYLSAFDRNLIFVIEYTDLSKVVIFFSLLMIFFIVPQSTHLLSPPDNVDLKMIVFPSTIVILSMAAIVGIYFYFVRDTEDLITNISVIAFPVAGVILITFLILSLRYKFSMLFVGLDALVIIGLSLLIGFVNGKFERYGKAVEYRIVRHEVDKAVVTYHRARLILFLSHHVAFLQGERVVIVPTADVAEMTSDFAGPAIKP